MTKLLDPLMVDIFLSTRNPQPATPVAKQLIAYFSPSHFDSDQFISNPQLATRNLLVTERSRNATRNLPTF